MSLSIDIFGFMSIDVDRHRHSQIHPKTRSNDSIVIFIKFYAKLNKIRQLYCLHNCRKRQLCL